MKPRNSRGQFIKGGGYKLTENHKRKIAQSHIGIGKNIPLSDNHKKAIALGMKGKNKNEKNPAWKGDKVKYSGLHNWVRRNLGTPNYCKFCKKTDRKQYVWANKSRQYKRDLNDWIRLCQSCHLIWDLKFKRTK